MDDEPLRAAIAAAIEISSYWTIWLMVLKIFTWFGVLGVSINVGNIIVARAGREVLSRTLTVKPMGDELGFKDDIFYSKWELNRIYELFLRGLAAEQKP